MRHPCGTFYFLRTDAPRQQSRSSASAVLAISPPMATAEPKPGVADEAKKTKKQESASAVPCNAIMLLIVFIGLPSQNPCTPSAGEVEGGRRVGGRRQHRTTTEGRELPQENKFQLLLCCFNLSPCLPPFPLSLRPFPFSSSLTLPGPPTSFI